MSIGKKFKDLMGIEEVYEDDFAEEYEDEEAVRRNEGRGGRAAVPARGGMKMVVIEPQSFEDSTALVDSLKARKPVIVNLEKLEQETAKKIFSFLNGATYALNGNVQEVTQYIFVFAPENVDIAAGVESRGFEFSGARTDDWR